MRFSWRRKLHNTGAMRRWHAAGCLHRAPAWGRWAVSCVRAVGRAVAAPQAYADAVNDGEARVPYGRILQHDLRPSGPSAAVPQNAARAAES